MDKELIGVKTEHLSGHCQEHLIEISQNLMSLIVIVLKLNNGTLIMKFQRMFNDHPADICNLWEIQWFGKNITLNMNVIYSFDLFFYPDGPLFP